VASHRYDRSGRALSDVVCDGDWVDAGDSLWPIRLYDEDCGDSRCDAFPEDSLVLSNDFQRLLWAKTASQNHLDTKSLLGDPLFFNRLPSMLSRDAQTKALYYRFRTFDSTPIRIRYNLWDWLGWQYTRLFRPRVSFDEHFNIPDTEVLEHFVFEFDPEHLYTRRAYGAHRSTDLASHETSFDERREPVQIETGICVPALYEVRRSLDDDTLLYTTTLDTTESTFGDGAIIDIRPVDTNKPRAAC
jgi:hypothetical protein